MILRPSSEGLCDINRDFKCDGVDLVLFRAALGSCQGDANYNVLADANLDGCVTPGDERVTFPTLPLSIDIKPGGFPNSINRKSQGKTPVAILSTPVFNAPTRVLKGSLTFGRTGNEQSLAFCNPGGEDVNGDGLLDLVCHFNTQQTGFQPGDTLGILKGKTKDDVPIKGNDSVRIVP
jgi:hypothetical protein